MSYKDVCRDVCRNVGHMSRHVHRFMHGHEYEGVYGHAHRQTTTIMANRKYTLSSLQPEARVASFPLAHSTSHDAFELLTVALPWLYVRNSFPIVSRNCTFSPLSRTSAVRCDRTYSIRSCLHTYSCICTCVRARTRVCACIHTHIRIHIYKQHKANMPVHTCVSSNG